MPQLRLGNLGAMEPGDGSHVTVSQLVPGLGEGVGKLFGVLVETLRDRSVDRIEFQGQVRREHDRGMTLLRVVRVRHCILRRTALGDPLRRASRTLGQFPLVFEQVVKVAVGPSDRRGGPSPFQAAGDRVARVAFAERVLPAQALLFEARRLGFRADELARIGGTVGFAEGVTASDQRDGLLIIHRHAGKGLANVLGRGERVRIAVGAFRVHIDQTHLHRGERIGELPVVGVTHVPQPFALRTPIDILLRLPHVGATAGETERFETHRLQRAVAGEDHQIGPRDFFAILLLDRPKQPSRFVEVRVVGPAVQRGEALSPVRCAATTVGDPIRAGAMPSHANEQRSVMPIVGWPPILGCRQQGLDVRFQGLQIECLELFGVIEVVTHRIAHGRILVQDPQVQLVGPPVAVRMDAGRRVSARRVADITHHRALASGWRFSVRRCRGRRPLGEHGRADAQHR